MTNQCELIQLKHKIDDRIKSRVLALKEQMSDDTRDNLLGIIETEFTGNHLALNLVQKMLDEHGIELDLSYLYEDLTAAVPSLNDVFFASPADMLSKFGSNFDGLTFIKRSFQKEAIRKSVLDTRVLGGSHTRYLVQTDGELRLGLAEWKNKMLFDIMSVIETSIANDGDDTISRDKKLLYELLGLYDPETGEWKSIFDLSEFTVFTADEGTNGPVYRRIMDLASVLVKEFDLDLKYFDFNGDIDTSSFFSNVVFLQNFDLLLDGLMSDIIKPDKKRAGDLNRRKYSLVMSEDSSLLELMLANDLAYENAANFISPSVSKILATVPMVSVSLSQRAGKPKLTMAPQVIKKTLDTRHLLQASAWIDIYLSELGSLLNMSTSDIYSNPNKVFYELLKSIHDFILYDWHWNGLLDSVGSLKAIRQHPDLAAMRAYLRRIKALLKLAGSTLNTLMSLYEFLYNNDETRLDKSTVSISDINAFYGYTPKTNIITDLIQLLISANAPAMIEYNQDGTIWDHSGSRSPLRNNYIQKSLSQKIVFSFRNKIKKTIHLAVSSKSTAFTDAVLHSQASSKQTFRLKLETAGYLREVGKMFGVSSSNADLGFLKQLLIEADDELHGGLMSLITQTAREIEALQKRNFPDSSAQYAAVSTAARNVLSGIDFEEIGRMLAPIISAAPTPTFYDRKGNQLGVYRTTSLAFMSDHLIHKYKSKPEDRMRGIKSNIFAFMPDLLLKGKNSSYLSQIAVPLTMPSKDDFVEARKLPEFVQDLHAFVGEYMSLMCNVDGDKNNPMAAFLLGAYSDKTTLIQFVMNMMAELQGKEMHSLLFSNTKRAGRLVYAFLSTQKLDLCDKILQDWVDIIQYLRENIDKIPYLGKNEDAIKNRDTLSKFLFSPEVEALLKYKSISPELSNPESNHSLAFLEYVDSFKDLHSQDEPFKKLTEETSILHQRVLNGMLLLNKALGLLNPKTRLKYYAFNWAADKTGVSLVEKLHFDGYHEDATDKKPAFDGLGVNRMLLADLSISCTVPELNIRYNTQTDTITPKQERGIDKKPSYTDSMVIEALSKPYYIDGLQITFFDYLVEYFTRNAPSIKSIIGFNREHGVRGAAKIFERLYNEDGSVNKLALFEIYYNYLLGTNFLRHQMLDLGIKEAYFDKGAHANADKERSNRLVTTSKRNNTLTATIKPFQLGLLDGINPYVRMAVIEDLPGAVFNTIGNYKNVDEFDGCGYTSPYQARMESRSLGEKSHTPVKKTFITPVHDYYAEELKWATNEITNQLIRESLGSEINLLSIYKRMHNIPFDGVITEFFDREFDGSPIYIQGVLGKRLFSREGFKYFEYKEIHHAGGTNYTLVKLEVDKYGNPIADVETVPLNNIDTIYSLYDGLNGINSMSLVDGLLEFSEAIHDFIFEVMTKMGDIDPEYFEDTTRPFDASFVHQPMKNAMIGILATNSSNKRGYCNVVPNEAWFDDSINLYSTEIDISTGGKLLDAEHEADRSRITRGTQLLLDMAQKGYTYELVTDVYKSIAYAMSISSESFNAISEAVNNNPLLLHAVISERIIKDSESKGNTKKIDALIAAFTKEAESLPNPEPVTLPLSLMVKDVIKSIGPELNHVIKQQDAGLMGVLNAASGFVQVYDINGESYTTGTLCSDAEMERFKAYEGDILNFVQSEFARSHNLSVDDCVRLLRIVDLNLRTEDNPDAIFAVIAQDGIELIITSMYDPQALRTLATSYQFNTANTGASDPDRFYAAQRVLVTSLQPGLWYLDPDPSKPASIIKMSSIKEIKDLLDKGIRNVWICHHKPSDLKPRVASVTYSVESVDPITNTVTTQTIEENEYTSFESMFALDILQAVKALKDPSVGFPPSVQSLLTHLKIKDVTETTLKQLQEDLVQFKNHAKSLGFTFGMSPKTPAGTYDWGTYFRGLDPRKNLLHQVQKYAVALYIQEHAQEMQDAIRFYVLTTSNLYKKEYLTTDTGELRSDILDVAMEHYTFFFTLIPRPAGILYTEALTAMGLYKIDSKHLQPALLIMPSIYRQQMKTNGKSLPNLTIDHFKLSPTFYKISPAFTTGTGKSKLVNVDFVVRTFRGRYNIAVVDSLQNANLFGLNITDRIQVNEEGYRTDRNGKRVLYKLPPAGHFAVYRNSDGTETILIKNQAETILEIHELTLSDETLVSVEPFLANIGPRQSIYHSGMTWIELLKELKTLNTIPAFDSMYDRLEEIGSNWGSDEELLVTLYNDHLHAESAYSELYANSLYISFLRSLDVIATRIPTLNMSSIMTMKVAALTSSKVNNVFVTKWQQWLLGSDYDIDKAFILGYNFDDYGNFVKWSPLQKTFDPAVFEASLDLPLPTGKRLGLEYKISLGQLVDKLGDDIFSDLSMLYSHKVIGETTEVELRSMTRMLANKWGITLTEDINIDKLVIQLHLLGLLLKRIDKVGGLFLGSTGVNYDVLQLIDKHNLYRSKVEGINNYSTHLMHTILNDDRNATTTYKSIDIATEAFNKPIEAHDWKLPLSNIDNGHSIASTTASAAVGKDGVGIGANGTKVYFSLLNYSNLYFQEDPPFTEAELIDSPIYNLTLLSLTYRDFKTGERKVWKRSIGPISDTILNDFSRHLYEGRSPLDFPFHLYDRDASQDVGALLSKAVDNAKDLSLDKLHAETDYFAMHIYLAMVGVPPEIILMYFNSDEFTEIIHKAQNDLAKGHTPVIDDKTFEGYPELQMIYRSAKELTAGALILSINQGIKVEEADIVAQRRRCSNLYQSTLLARGVKGDWFDLNLLNLPDKEKSVTAIKARKANILMGNVKINGKQMTLLTPFNFDEFLKNDAYRKAVIAVMDVVKYNYNIFDLLDKAPHFLQMLRSYNTALKALAIPTAALLFEMETADSLYSLKLLPTDENQVPIYDMPATYSEKLIKPTQGYFRDKLFSSFLLLISKAYGMAYTEGTKRLTCDFLSDNALHELVELVNAFVIPKLYNAFPENLFLQGLEIHDVEYLNSGNIFYGYEENLKTMANIDYVGDTPLAKIQEAYDLVKDIKVKDLLGDGFVGNAQMTVGDLLYIYNTIAKTVVPKLNDISELSSLEVLNPNSLEFQFANYVRAVDAGRIKLDHSSINYMASLVKYLTASESTVSGDGSRTFTKTAYIGNVPIFYQSKEINAAGVVKQNYTRYFLNMPYRALVSLQPLLLADLFKYAITSKRLLITKIDINC